MTVLKFNPSSSLLVSGSPDNSIRVVSIPHTIAGSSSGFFAFVLLAIVILILALVARQYPGALPW
ncbi:hypothetical protein CPC08DRAFT_57386 [Agrocybe pediades]|nr:hypothetical protein CPC08DRAFT_57386 [Agrocybe pediades]